MAFSRPCRRPLSLPLERQSQKRGSRFPYLLKADLYPGLVDKLHESSTTNTFLYSFRHRGAACKELGGHGETRNQYKAYTFGGDEK